MYTNQENFSVGETIQLFGIGRTKLFELIKRGDIEAIKLGRRTLIRADSARSFIESLPRVGQGR
jgi:excisionase family DNA binding protein